MLDVLFVADWVSLPNGVTMVMKNIIDHNDFSKIKFSLLAEEGSQQNVLDYFRSKGVDVYQMPDLSILSVHKLYAYLRDFFSERQFDIIHCHFFQLANMVFRIARQYGNPKCITHSHSSKLSESKIREIRNKILSFRLIDSSDYCAACSNSAGIALFGNEFLKSGKKMIVKNGIDCKKFCFNKGIREAIRKEFRISNDCLVIGHIGRFTPVKNHRFMVDILNELISNGSNCKFMFVGDGDTRSSVEEYANSKGLKDNIIFVGYTPDTYKYLNAFDVFLMPSLHEGLGLSAIEAQANGLPCVLSSSIPHEVDITGVSFIDIHDSISKWTKEILNKTDGHNPDFNRMVIEAGYEISDVCNKLFSFYKNIISV